MRELDCDFCGASAAGAYEVLPAELDPEPGEQVRVVLCDDCRETLDGVLAPLLDRLGAGGATATGAADGGTRTAGTGSVPADAGTPPAAGSAGGSGSGAGGDAGSGGTDGTGAETEGDAQANARSGDPSLPADDAIILGGDEGDDGDAAADTDDADASDGGAGAEGGSADEPDQFRRVMRLLGGREFPLDRAEVADIAGSAYGLDRAETDRIVDYAIDRDVLEEEDGELQKA